MGKKDDKKPKNNKSNVIKPVTNIPPKSVKPETSVAPHSVKQELKKKGIARFFDNTWAVIGAIILLIGGLASWIAIENEWFKSPEKKFKEETSVEGDLKAPALPKRDNS